MEPKGPELTPSGVDEAAAGWPPIEYSIPQPWGTIRVSRGAHQDYQWVAQAANTQAGNSPRLMDGAGRPLPNPRLDIGLLAPGEFRNGIRANGTRFAARPYPGGIALSVVAEEDSDPLRSRIIDLALAELYDDDHDPPDMLANAADPARIALLRSRARLRLVADTLEVAIPGVLEDYHDWWNRLQRPRHHRRGWVAGRLAKWLGTLEARISAVDPAAEAQRRQAQRELAETFGRGVADMVWSAFERPGP